MTVRNQIIATSIFAACCLVSSSSFAEDVKTYICIEQRAVGWEPREGGKEVFGKFSPSEEKFFVKFYSLKLDSNGKIDELPKIEVIEGNETFRYTDTSCDRHFRDFFTDPFSKPKEQVSSVCADKSNDRKYELFSGLGIFYQFNPPLKNIPKSTTFRYAQILLNDRAYLDQGSCVLSD